MYLMSLLDLENFMLLDQENIMVLDHVNIMLMDEVKESVLLLGCMNLKMMSKSGIVILSYG